MKKLLSVLLIISLLFSFLGCKSEPVLVQQPTEPSTEPVQTTAPAPTVAEIYDAAVQKFLDSERITLNVQQKRTVCVGIQNFEETLDYKLKYRDLGTEEFAANLSGTVDFGTNHSITIDERYADGTVYGFVGEFGYHAESDQDTFFSRYVPPVVLDLSLYDQVVFIDDTTISFTGAKDIETWLDQPDFILEEASGTATLDGDGALSAYTYLVKYTYGSVVIELSTSSTIEYEAKMILPADKHAADQEVFDSSIPMMIERGYGYLLQSDTFSATTTSVIASDALGVSYSIQRNFDLYYMDKLKMSNSTVAELYDASTDSYETYYINENYNNGVYTTTVDDEQPQEQTVYTAEIVEIAKILKTGIYPRLENLDEMYISLVHGGVVIDYTYTRNYETILRQECQMALSGDMNILERESREYTPQYAEGYLAIDTYTGLPTAVSLTYAGAHTIDGEQYWQSQQVNVAMDAASLSAYSNITGEKLPASEPVEKPTPAFYRVTGNEGQEMWLLGTIHVGDVRTDYLPQEIYDAFASSDALALEFDMDAFNARLDEDPQFAQQMYEQVLYLDGTTIEDHLEGTEVYAAAVQTMKMTGSLTSVAMLMKPSMWSQIIENFYVRVGYRYSSDYGVDMQLMKLAQDQNKTILNVESGEEQMQMFADYSDEVQQMLLEGSLSIDPLTYNAQLDEMFEKWCAGEEESLRELLIVDTSQMTPEELDAYEEYEKAMSTDRDAGMLEVAKGYLESGETVFFAVGLAHLLAEEGLVNTLRDAGYNVEKVSYE